MLALLANPTAMRTDLGRADCDAQRIALAMGFLALRHSVPNRREENACFEATILLRIAEYDSRLATRRDFLRDGKSKTTAARQRITSSVKPVEYPLAILNRHPARLIVGLGTICCPACSFPDPVLTRPMSVAGWLSCGAVSAPDSSSALNFCHEFQLLEVPFAVPR
jgi:hypothetical protein